MGGALTKHKWMSATILAVVLPISLLTAFRLTGILPEPQEPETITLEVVGWNVSRPLRTITFSKIILNNYTCNGVLVKLDVFLGTYHVNFARYYYDTLTFVIESTLNVTNGFIHSLAFRFSRTDAYAFVNIYEDPDLIIAQNLQLEKIDDPVTSEYEGYVLATAINRPSSCFFRINADWVFIDENDRDHPIIITLEATYFNGTSYQKALIPIRLEVLAP